MNVMGKFAREYWENGRRSRGVRRRADLVLKTFTCGQVFQRVTDPSPGGGRSRTRVKKFSGGGGGVGGAAAVQKGEIAFRSIAPTRHRHRGQGTPTKELERCQREKESARKNVEKEAEKGK